MSRRVPAVVLALLLAALAAALVVTVPWTPLPGADLDPDAARDFTSAQRAREVAFHDALRPTSYASLALALVVVSVLALTGTGARLVRAVARPLGGGWVWQVVLGTLAVTVVVRLATLPLRMRSESVLREYGLSTQTWPSWALDLLRGLLVDTGLSAVALLALVGIARAAPRTWWAWGAASTAALVVAGSFAYPLVVEPVFNDFTSLPAGPLREQVLDLAARDGIVVDDVLVSDASRRTTALNAYVSGFGGSRRIVLYDTLVERATPEEVALVVAHELGHAEEGDVLAGTLLGALGSAAAVCALALLLSWSPVLRRSGAEGMHDPRIVPLLLALVAVGTLLLAPASNLVSRRVEARADVHSLDLTRDPRTFAASQRRLAVANLSDLEPHPFAYAVFASHPSTTERLALVREWERLRGRP
ncbi:MAG: Peptidase, M48 family [uncultured Frankineae bacterium]|uniref:Peptidase, M48 family n=1 Tax=uncultured Frankineae bacterium TaxID=437475 RepID=A0A6J4M1A9_9ACTN|nr:MAG: Peptidase, M48 family [uncultured Frankineae bacterium]